MSFINKAFESLNRVFNGEEFNLNPSKPFYKKGTTFCFFGEEDEKNESPFYEVKSFCCTFPLADAGSSSYPEYKFFLEFDCSLAKKIDGITYAHDLPVMLQKVIVRMVDLSGVRIRIEFGTVCETWNRIADNKEILYLSFQAKSYLKGGF